MAAKHTRRKAHTKRKATKKTHTTRKHHTKRKAAKKSSAKRKRTGGHIPLAILEARYNKLGRILAKRS